MVHIVARSSVPALRCSARAKASGVQCRQWAIRGGTVCRVHGGAAPQVRAAAARRVALAEAVAAGDRRHPAEVLLDVIHHADVIMRRAVVEDSADQAAVLEAIQQAGAFARDALRLQVDQRQLDLQRQRVEADQAALVAACLRVALVAAGFDRAQQDRALAELGRVLSRVDVDGDRVVLAEAQRLERIPTLQALPPGESA